MPPSRRRPAPRRRRADDGEDEDSVAGDVEEDSLSEGSAASLAEEDGDAEASDASLDDDNANSPHPQTLTSMATSNQKVGEENKHEAPVSTGKAVPVFTSSAENDTTMNGLKPAPAVDGVEEVRFNDANSDIDHTETDPLQSTEAQTNAPRAPQNETPAQKSRREHQEYLRERNSNPAFVPNRGGFFLHDDRSSSIPAYSGRPFPRGRGRGYEQSFHGPRIPFSEPTSQQWAHDLHDKHENLQTQPPKPAAGVFASQPPPGPASAPATSTAPNRTFSFSTVLGNVTIYISLPGMSEKKAVSNVVKKHHTLLPQHRPPLRRDKPVRISIPDDDPRYIFPSTERSFIFIPRALRPNQQSYFRGRGRGSFHGSRRTSVFGGSTYTPSVAMSRKSSFGGVGRDAIRSPTGSATSRPMGMGLEVPRPVVRLPSANVMPVPMAMQSVAQMPPYASQQFQTNGSMAYGFHSTAIPMHQPRPQKTVSVADIESPATLSVKAPQQQQEQPFHQQMPIYVGGNEELQAHGQMMGRADGPGETTLSHIPEGAIYAQAFQPYPFMQPPIMYGGSSYGNAATFYPQMSNGMQFAGPQMSNGMHTAFPQMSNGINFASPPPPMAMAPAFAPAPMQAATQPQPQGSQAGTMAHESNGMVFYYDPSQFSGVRQHDQYPMVPVPTMMNPQAAYYNPNGPNGVYYPAQSS